MKKMIIYEPAMCCETGICGVGVEPELLRISAAVSALKKEGISIERYNLSSAPMKFVESEPVSAFLRSEGADGLPVITVDGDIVITGRYPSNEEVISLLGLPESMLSSDVKEENEDKKGSCCSDVAGESCCGDSAKEEKPESGCCCGGCC